MSRVKLVGIVAGVAVICLIVVIVNSEQDESGSTGGVAREYGSLDDEPSDGATGVNAVTNEAAAPASTNLDLPRDHEDEHDVSGKATPDIDRDSVGAERASRAADAYRISGRSTGAFNRERLAESGLSEAKIDEIELGMRDYARWLRDSSGGEFPPPAIKLTPEEREVRRETRAGFLSDEEYDAALFATGQKNAAVFANMKPGSDAWAAGLRTGDVLEIINGMPIFDVMDFADGRDQMNDGEMHVLSVNQGGETRTIMVECCRPGWGPVDMTTRAPLNVEGAD